ncbi:hypothetical protein M885DRAFT_510296 [Pelagophyceae sp. CCMP2097]|nr:hypothetical protein M885DRAFT_510296 [Pelagophyceae sp. CCMP2097]
MRLWAALRLAVAAAWDGREGGQRFVVSQGSPQALDADAEVRSRHPRPGRRARSASSSPCRRPLATFEDSNGSGVRGAAVGGCALALESPSRARGQRHRTRAQSAALTPKPESILGRPTPGPPFALTCAPALGLAPEAPTAGAQPCALAARVRRLSSREGPCRPSLARGPRRRRRAQIRHVGYWGCSRSHGGHGVWDPIQQAASGVPWGSPMRAAVRDPATQAERGGAATCAAFCRGACVHGWDRGACGSEADAWVRGSSDICRDGCCVDG